MIRKCKPDYWVKGSGLNTLWQGENSFYTFDAWNPIQTVKNSPWMKSNKTTAISCYCSWDIYAKLSSTFSHNTDWGSCSFKPLKDTGIPYRLQGQKKMLKSDLLCHGAGSDLSDFWLDLGYTYINHKDCTFHLLFLLPAWQVTKHKVV